MKLAVYGIGESAEVFWNVYKMCADENDFKICCFIQTQKSCGFFHDVPVIDLDAMNPDDFDKLVLALNYINRAEVLDILKNKYIDYELRIKPKIIEYEEALDLIGSNVDTKYNYVCTGRLNFMTDSKDIIIGYTMAKSGKVWAQESIDCFFDLIKTYYKLDMSGKYLFDIGANIGTTSIYSKKIINSSIKVIAIEANKKNYDLLRVNCILNDVDDIITELLALSNNEGHARSNYNIFNSGGSGVVLDDCISTDNAELLIRMTTLDDYIFKKEIALEEIGCIWMDTEGFEAKIIEGGMNTLSKRKIPLLMEFNPMNYIKNGEYDKFVCNVSKLYSGFIDIHCESLIRHNISNISEYAKGMNYKPTDLFLC